MLSCCDPFSDRIDFLTRHGFQIGIIPGGGGTQRFPGTVGKFKAMRYVLTGDIFGAKEASDMNLVSEVVPDAEVEKRAIAMAVA
jgi:enoyl-CoA hydratase/carnithine racemase